MRSPLTFQQRSLWKLIQQYPEWKCAVPHAFRLRGALNAALFEGALGEIIRRHGILRARLTTVDREPQIEIPGAQEYHLEITRPPGESRSELEMQATRHFSRFCERIIDPVEGPLLRAQLVRLSDDEHWLFVALHRLAADCFSAEQVFQEIWVSYRELAHQHSAALPANPSQYADYAQWQHKHGDDWLHRHEAYWQKRLTGASRLQWPLATGAASTAHGVTGMMSVHLGKQLSDELQSLAKRTRSLSAMVMLSAYVAVLSRWCGQKDFILPFYVAGRQSEHKCVVGYFSHVLYLRFELTGREKFAALLGLVSNEFFRALAHQDFGHQATERSDLLSGAFCQWVTWQTEAAPNEDATAALAIERLPLGQFGQGLSILPPGMVDVDLTFFDTTEGIYAQGVYRTDRLPPDSAERLMTDLRATTALLIANPDSRITEIDDRTLNRGNPHGCTGQRDSFRV
jgi:hypothetical protein